MNRRKSEPELEAEIARVLRARRREADERRQAALTIVTHTAAEHDGCPICHPEARSHV